MSFRFVSSWISLLYIRRTISRGAFSKGLSFADLSAYFLPLAIACVVLLGLSVMLLKKQET
jgi:ribosome-dependent ATPase